MPLSRDTIKRAEGWGYYTTYTSSASDVLGYISGSLTEIDDFEPFESPGERIFKVTVIVEKQ